MARTNITFCEREHKHRKATSGSSLQATTVPTTFHWGTKSSVLTKGTKKRTPLRLSDIRFAQLHCHWTCQICPHCSHQTKQTFEHRRVVQSQRWSPLITTKRNSWLFSRVSTAEKFNCGPGWTTTKKSLAIVTLSGEHNKLISDHPSTQHSRVTTTENFIGGDTPTPANSWTLLLGLAKYHQCVHNTGSHSGCAKTNPSLTTQLV